MPDIYYDVDAALTAVPVNVFPLTDDTDFKTRETAVAYNAAGMDLVWNFVTSAGAFTQTAVTPTTAGTYDWTHQGDGMYTIEIPDSGGASINNNTEGYGWFTGVATGVLPWRGPVVGFRHSSINDSLCDTNTTGLLAPTTAGRTLDVASTGEAGVDLNNVNVPNGPIAFLGIVDNGTAQSATATTLVARAAAPDGSIQAGMTLMAYGSTQGYWQSVIIDSVSADTYTINAWPLATPSGTITYYVQGTPAGSPNLLPDVNVLQISGDATAANNCESFFDGTGYAGTGNTIPTVTTVNGLAANVITAAATATDFGTEVFTAVVTSQLTESYAADNTAPTMAQALFMIQQMLSEKAVASTTLTVKKLDGSTTAATFTLNDGTSPTSITRAT